MDNEFPSAASLVSEAIGEYIVSCREDDDEWNNKLADILEGAVVTVNGEEL